MHSLAQRLDHALGSGRLAQAVVGVSAMDGHDYYRRRNEWGHWQPDVESSNTWLWSLGTSVWLGASLTERIKQLSVPAAIASTTPVGDGCRLDLAPGADIDDFDLALAPLRSPLTY